MTTVTKNLREYAFQIVLDVARLAGKDLIDIWNSENFQRELTRIAERDLERLKREQK